MAKFIENKEMFTLQSKSQISQKNYSGQKKKSLTALKDRLLVFEPPSTVQNSKFGTGLSSRCEDSLSLGLSSFCGSGEACMSVCGWGRREFVVVCFEYVCVCGGGHIMNMLS